MTRYSELYRAEQTEKERLQRELTKQIERLVDQVSTMRSFILENNLQGQLAEWSTKRSNIPGGAQASTERQPPNSVCKFCARRVFEPCQSEAQAQNACTLSSHDRDTAVGSASK